MNTLKGRHRHFDPPPPRRTTGPGRPPDRRDHAAVGPVPAARQTTGLGDDPADP